MTNDPRPPFVDFRAVKAQVTMEEVFARYGLLETMKRSGDSLSGTCPIHKGTNPTQFRVSVTKSCWNCFGDCKTGGNVLDFVARMEDCGVRDAAYRLADWFGIELASRYGKTAARDRISAARNQKPPAAAPPAKTEPSKTQAPVEPAGSLPRSASTKRSRAQTPDGESSDNKPLGFTLKDLDGSHPYLAERELSPETIADFGVGLCNAGTMIGRIAIPIHNVAGQLVGYIGRWPGNPPGETPKYKLPKEFKRSAEVFNLWRAPKESMEEPLVIVEGVFDVMKLWQNGVRRVVALMGSSMSAAQEALIRPHTEPTGRILVMLDGDEAGRAGGEEVTQRLTRHAYVKVHAFEKNGQQPEDLTRDELAVIIGGDQ